MKSRTLAGISLISSATLCLEISLTRYFSVSQQYHFAFWVVSIAFLGYGASGSFLALFKAFASADRDRFLSYCSLLYAMTILLSFLLCNIIPFDFIRLSWDSSQIGYVFLYDIVLSLPFFFGGLTISFAISRAAELVSKIYFFDLFGAGAGTLLALLIFLLGGDKGAIISVSFLALFASFLFSPARLTGHKVLLASLMAAEIGLLFLSPSSLSFRISPYKALSLALKYPNAKQLHTLWNATSRVDILESPAVRYAPGLSLLYDKKLPDQLGLSVDGGELSAITRVDDEKDPSLAFLSALPSSLAYRFVQSPRTLIIEPKGGMDVLSAVIFNSSQVRVIESNPLISRILRRELARFSGYIYRRKNIDLISAYSWAYLKKDRTAYDLIILSLTDVFGSSGTGLFGFGENYLYTIDSFAQILDRLSPEGLVASSYYLLPPPRQETRVLATWIEALERKNIDPSSHLIAIRSWGTISFFVRKRPFTNDDIQQLKAFAGENLFDLVYYPGIKSGEVNIYNKFEKPLYYDLTLQLISPRQRKILYDDYLFRIRPATDNRPFFFNFFRLSKLRATYKALGRKWLPFLQGEFLVYLLLLQSVIIALIMIILPYLSRPRKKEQRKVSSLKIFSYFGLIGMAFMLVEITFIQKFILFLGHSVYSASVVISSLLISSGLGSFFSRKILAQNLKRNLKKSLLLCSVFLVAYLFLFSFLDENFIGLPLVLKMLLVLLFIFPLGFLMGFPFPSGIRLLTEREKRLIPWAWAVNAFSSVVNSIFALVIAFWGGYNLVLMIAAAGYSLALPFLNFSDHRDKDNI